MAQADDKAPSWRFSPRLARVIRRAALLTLAVLVAIVVTQAGAATPPGPRLVIVAHDSCCGTGLVTVGSVDEPSRGLLDDPRILVTSDRPSWSADGSLLAFAASRLGDDGPVVAVVKAEGSGLRVYPRALLEGNAVMAPDGGSVAFPRTQLVKVLPGRENYLVKSSIWSLDVEDGSVRRMTQWRLATYLFPSSYSPDGSTLAMTYYNRRGARAVALDVRSGKLREIARHAWEPTYSPNGTRLAFIRRRAWEVRADDPKPVTELVAAQADGSERKSLLRRVGLIAWPSWDPSGSRLAFTLSPVDSPRSLTPLLGDKVMAINADGTCLTRVFSDPELTLKGAVWQPGIGREAGPIAC